MEYTTNNEYTERATNNEYTKRATNNDNEISNDLVSETGSSIQTESSSNSGRPPADIWEEFNSINNGAGKHKGASCKVPKEIRMKVLRDIQSESISPESTASKKRKLEYSQLSVDAYFDVKEAINKAKEK
ncbi:zinc finger bed domain-containing protein 1-like [Gigaspora margarita]|uniref:Zinc finger bed domain-containing protein 1-like n=1 Tax=Gigaspora margarita TaxID=4874 RepID=A0A8H4EGT2_GIGMA|nr:zinc finger bed domain-containing protein 1-like [Gigaspora margarita]